MAPINWYSVRHYLKWTLISVTILFFLVTILQLLFIRQQYIQRYVEMHLQDNGDHHQNPSSSLDGGKHPVFSVDEEVDFDSGSFTNFTGGDSTGNDTTFAVNAEQKGSPPEKNNLHQKRSFSSEVKLLSGIIISAIIIIELLYCALYLYIIFQKKFCSMFCFALLSLSSLVFHIQLHLTIQLEYDDEDFLGKENSQIDTLDAETLLNHITRSSLTEVILSVLETILSLAYSAILYRFPGRTNFRSHRNRFGFFRLGGGRHRNHHFPEPAGNGGDNHRPLPNGHAVSMEMHSIDGDEDGDRPVQNNHHQQGDNSSQSSVTTSSSSSLSEAADQPLNSPHQRTAPAVFQSPTTSTSITTTLNDHASSPPSEVIDGDLEGIQTVSSTSH